GWGIPAIVGAGSIDVRDGEVVVGDRILREGAALTIDGSTGEVFVGLVAGSTTVVPESGTLREWAEELGIAIGQETSPAEPAANRFVTREACLRAIAVKGFAPLEGLADAVVSNHQAVRTIADQLVADGLVAEAAGAYKLTDVGKVRAGELLQAEREAWGPEAAAALDAFLDLDHRMKDA